MELTAKNVVKNRLPTPLRTSDTSKKKKVCFWRLSYILYQTRFCLTTLSFVESFFIYILGDILKKDNGNQPFTSFPRYLLRHFSICIEEEPRYIFFFIAMKNGGQLLGQGVCSMWHFQTNARLFSSIWKVKHFHCNNLQMYCSLHTWREACHSIRNNRKPIHQLHALMCLSYIAGFVRHSKHSCYSAPTCILIKRLGRENTTFEQTCEPPAVNFCRPL